MGRADYYAEGDWNAVCHECGKKFKASQLKRHWQGYYVCEKHWEPRHPQDFVRAVPDVQTPPWVQSQGGTCLSLTAIADEAVAECAIADFIS